MHGSISRARSAIKGSPERPQEHREQEQGATWRTALSSPGADSEPSCVDLRMVSTKTIEQAAEELECSPAKISRLETGRGVPKQRDVRDLLRLYGVGSG